MRDLCVVSVVKVKKTSRAGLTYSQTVPLDPRPQGQVRGAAEPAEGLRCSGIAPSCPSRRQINVFCGANHLPISMRQRSDCVPKHGSHLLTPQLPVEASSSSWSGGYLLLMFVICACLWCLQEDVGLGVRKRDPQVGNDEILVPNVFNQADGEGSSSPTHKVGEEIRKVGFLDAEGEENSAVVDAEAEREGFLAWKRVEPDCKVTKEAALHTARRIKEAVVVMEPYPHVQVGTPSMACSLGSRVWV